ncbi:MAG: hypothetical protein IPJ60_03225 [Sphingobacteriaceae bacterium]|nr:hypothetical protein [Sphingobacteriaceae bacterium]
MKPKPADHPPYYQYYIGLVDQQEIVDALAEGKKLVSAFIKVFLIQKLNMPMPIKNGQLNRC